MDIHKIKMAVAIGLALGAVVMMGIGYSECSDQGGKYVRGLFWMECVEV